MIGPGVARYHLVDFTLNNNTGQLQLYNALDVAEVQNVATADFQTKHKTEYAHQWSARAPLHVPEPDRPRSGPGWT